MDSKKTRHSVIDFTKLFLKDEDINIDFMATKEHPHNYWNKEHCTEELSKYTRKLEAKHGSPGAYNSAYQHGWLETIAPHLISKTY